MSSGDHDESSRHERVVPTDSSLLGNRHWYRVETPDGDRWRVVVGFRGSPLRLPDSISVQPLISAMITLLIDGSLRPLGLVRGRRVAVYAEKDQEVVGRCRYGTLAGSTAEADRVAGELVDELRQGRFRWDPQRSARSQQQMAEAKAAKAAAKARADSPREAIVRAAVAAIAVAAAVWCLAALSGAGDDKLASIVPSVLALILITDAVRSLLLHKPRGTLMGVESRSVCAGLAIFAAIFTGMQ